MDFTEGMATAGKTFAQSALMEAYEEGGVRGDVAASPMGSYNYEKLASADSDAGAFVVDVFPVRFSRQEKYWPERGERQREWLSIGESSRRVEEPT